MTITREGRERIVVFQCDAKRCANVCNTELDDFEDALVEARDQGWRIRKVNGEWQHFCPDEELDGLNL